VCSSDLLVTPAPEPPPPVTAPRAPLDAAAAVEYERLLVAWLEKHKQYPKRAKRLRIEGEALLRIRIDRAGHTLTVALERPTGNRLLDQAALDMARRANPFPSMPADDPRSELEFRVPVAFTMR
jgi:protein TonB